MSRIYIGIILLITMGIGGFRLSVHETDDIDGGVKTYNNGEDSPKVIESTEILSFECEFSLISTVLEEENELDGIIYKLSAVSNSDNINCKIEWKSRDEKWNAKEFTADALFMTGLQEIVSKYDFAIHNGYINRVSGLPYMYGAKLNIKYASGESIYAYDNQHCFILFDAMKELVELFMKNCEGL